MSEVNSRKRKSEKQLTKDDVSDDDEGEQYDEQNWQATPEEMQKRRIVKVKRKAKTETPTNTATKPAWDFSFTAPKQEAATKIEFPSSEHLRIKELEAEVKTLREKLAQAEKEIESIKGTKPSITADLETPKSTTVETGTQNVFEIKDLPATATNTPNTATTTTNNQFNFDFSGGFNFPTTASWPSFDATTVKPDSETKQEWEESQNYNPEQEVPITPTVTEATKLLSNEPQKTGEEDEKTIIEAKCKAYVMVKKVSEDEKTTTSEWKEAAVGKIRINELKEPAGKARVIMRTQTTFKLVLNSLIFEAMSVKRMQDKQLILGIVEDGAPKSYLIKFADAETAQSFYEKLEEYKKK